MILGAMVVGISFYNLGSTTLTWTFAALGVAIIFTELWEASSISTLSARQSI
jgi:hypothetical protein